MKLGDSLGRSRRRKRRGDRTPAPAPSEADALSVAEARAEVDAGPASTDADDGDRSAAAPEEAQEGTPPGGSGGSSARRRWLTGRAFLVGIGALVVLGWGFGYTIATRVLFPAPPPAGDLFDVPDLRGLGLASARERLAGAGLEIGGVDSLRHPSVASGLVLGQSPLPGQLSSPASPVRVTLSSGPERRSVPDVRRLDQARARVVLETSGFVVDVVVAESEAPRGSVIDLTPPPDSVVALPAAVRLVVSAGPPIVLMPLVLGLEQSEAEGLLDSLGLVVADVEEVFRFGRDQGIVVEQEPAADSDLQRGSTVRLKVGRRNNAPYHP